MKKFTIYFILLMLSNGLFAGIDLVRDGKPTGRILVGPDNKNENQAATLLNDYVKKISGITLPVESSGTKYKSGDIIIKTSKNADIKEDGFRLSSDGNSFLIEGGDGMGTVYGVVTVLEDYFRVKAGIFHSLQTLTGLRIPVSATGRHSHTISHSIPFIRYGTGLRNHVRSLLQVTGCIPSTAFCHQQNMEPLILNTTHSLTGRGVRDRPVSGA